MNNSNPRRRYLQHRRNQLRNELDRMGYGQRPLTLAEPQDQSKGAPGFVIAFTTIAALFLGLSLTGLIA